MTYKSFVKQIIINAVETYARKLLKNNECYFGESEIVELEMKEQLYKVKISVHEFESYLDRIYYVGGAFDDYATIYNSVIWDENDNVIWLNTKEGREALNLPEKIEL